MIPPEIVVVPVIFGMPAFVILIRMRFKHEERMAMLNAQKQRTGRDPLADARLERIEHAVEAMAVELERVGEGQRFLTRVLGERHLCAGDRSVAEAGPSMRGTMPDRPSKPPA